MELSAEITTIAKSNSDSQATVSGKKFLLAENSLAAVQESLAGFGFASASS